MTTTIALAGKGGVGKTTIAGMVIKYLAQQQRGAILAIDADPSSNLNMVLGLDLEWTVGDIREGILDKVKESLTASGAAMGALEGGISKREYLDYEIRSSLAEGSRFDLIAMGRTEGPGCYCAVNHNLREVIDGLSKNYRYVVIDNEAGMEHLSRRTTRRPNSADCDQSTLESLPPNGSPIRHDLDIHRKPTRSSMAGEQKFCPCRNVSIVDIFAGNGSPFAELTEFEFSGRVELSNESCLSSRCGDVGQSYNFRGCASRAALVFSS
jgi:hypothetical protein